MFINSTGKTNTFLVITALTAGAFSSLCAALVWFYIGSYSSTFMPGVFINGISVGGKTPAEVSTAILETPPAQFTVTANFESRSIASSSGELGLHHEVSHVLDAAFSLGHETNVIRRFKSSLSTLIKPVQFSTQLAFNHDQVASFIDQVKEQAEVPGENPSVTLKSSNNKGSLVVFPGKLGKKVQTLELEQQIQQQANAHEDRVIAVPFEVSNFVLTSEQQDQAKKRAENFVGKTIKVSSPDQTIRLEDRDLVKLLQLPDGFNQDLLSELIQSWKPRIERSPQDAEFSYDAQTLKVTAFKPHQDGLEINLEESISSINKTLAKLETDVTAASEPKTTYSSPLVLKTTAPQKTLSSTNDLGINQRIGFGESEYQHSIPTRIYNVALAASRVSNTIVKPGDEFSFNKTLGEVSRGTGFQPAYVIRSGQTVLGDGGGVCQVSTTLFRALLNAGLPITKRKAHSYRVSYYELDNKPGIDATVYSGDVDLRFINDTGKYLLIRMETDSEHLTMKTEIYGTSDGRTSEIVDHKTWDLRSPPAPLYIPDPSLPPGKLKQIDWSASGIKASFKNIVKDASGKVIREDTYYSNYIPWSAKYLRGV